MNHITLQPRKACLTRGQLDKAQEQLLLAIAAERMSQSAQDALSDALNVRIDPKHISRLANTQGVPGKDALELELRAMIAIAPATIHG